MRTAAVRRRTYANSVCSAPCRGLSGESGRGDGGTAIYHLSYKPISRSDGRSAVASAAYRAGERLRDERTGLLYDYSHRKEEARIESWIQAPEGAPAWARDRARLWNGAEAKERRKNSRVAREVEVSLPIELDREQQNELLRGFVRDEITGRGLVADVCIHRGDVGNPHAHIMLTTRLVGPEGFATKDRDLDKGPTLGRWRESWHHHQNRELERAGSDARVDHRSHKDRGLDSEPTTHEGPNVRAMEAKGSYTDRGAYNRGVVARNAERDHRLKEEVRAVQDRQREGEVREAEEVRQAEGVQREEEALREEERQVEERRRRREEREAREREEHEHEREM